MFTKRSSRKKNIKKINMNNKNSNNSIGLGTILFLIFMVLKLTNHVDWSWWWITSPLWIPLTCLLILILIEYIVFKKK